MSTFWDLLGNIADTVEKAQDARDDTYGVIGRTIVLTEKVGNAKDLHDRMKKLGQEEKKPSTARFVFELGSHFLGRRK
jgi:hypothetical protein